MSYDQSTSLKAFAMDFIIGFVIAVVIALTGVGAGVITAPLLILFLHIPVGVAVTTALAYSAIVKLIVVPVQVVRQQVSYRVLGFMLIGGLPGVIIGSIWFKHVSAQGSCSMLYLVLGALSYLHPVGIFSLTFTPGALRAPRAIAQS
jgi:uncharacterized protein